MTFLTNRLPRSIEKSFTLAYEFSFLKALNQLQQIIDYAKK